MFSDWVSFLAYPNLFGIKGFVVVVSLCIWFTILWYNLIYIRNWYFLSFFLSFFLGGEGKWSVHFKILKKKKQKYSTREFKLCLMYRLVSACEKKNILKKKAGLPQNLVHAQVMLLESKSCKQVKFPPIIVCPRNTSIWTNVTGRRNELLRLVVV
jgi:hypothetical protein